MRTVPRTSDEFTRERKLSGSCGPCVLPLTLERADGLLPMRPEPDGIVGSPGRLCKTQNGGSRQKEKKNSPADSKRASRQRLFGTAAKEQKNSQRTDADGKASPEQNFSPERFCKFESFPGTGVRNSLEDEGRHRLCRIDVSQEKANACVCACKNDSQRGNENCGLLEAASEGSKPDADKRKNENGELKTALNVSGCNIKQCDEKNQGDNGESRSP